MAFKFGVTVMNCLQPNLPENFDLIATVEAFDTYNNLKSAIFNHYKSELQCLCHTEEGKEPHVMIVFKVQDTIKIPVVVEIFSGLVESPFLHDVVEIDNEVVEVKPDFFLPLSLVVALSITVPFAIDVTQMIC